jgi:hypothetical protein
MKFYGLVTKYLSISPVLLNDVVSGMWVGSVYQTKNIERKEKERL